jgi:hypothetical protein
MMDFGFDFDGVLNGNASFEKFIRTMLPVLNDPSNSVIVITSRDAVTRDIHDRIKELGLNVFSIHAIGRFVANGMWMTKGDFIKSSMIHLDMFFDDDSTEIRSMVEKDVPCCWVPPQRGTLMFELEFDD